MFSVLLRGIIIGFSIAAPVGPIGVLCIRRTLADGRLNGLLSGLGAASADACYGAIAAFGLTFISTILIQQQFVLGLIGGLFLLFLGIGTIRAEPATQAVSTDQRRTGLMEIYLSTFLLTLTNPVTILAFMAIFAGVGISASGGSYVAAIVMVVGVFTGSAPWWVVLSSGVSLLRERFSPRWILWTTRLSGTIITVFGLVTLINLR